MQVSNYPSNYLQQYLRNQPTQAGGLGAYGQAAQSGIADSQATSTGSTNPVSLSDAARALSAQAASSNGGASLQAGSSDFSQEAQLLGGFADKALAAMGVISPADESGVKINFDALSYQVDSSLSASQTQQGGQVTSQFAQQQDATFAGEGQITTADGRTFDFQIQVQLDQSQQFTQQSAANDGTQNVSLPTLAAPATTASNSGDSPASSDSAGATANSAKSGAASSGLINWDAIMKQSKGLIDLLDSLAAAGLSTTSSGAAGASNAANSSSTANAAKATASA